MFQVRPAFADSSYEAIVSSTSPAPPVATTRVLHVINGEHYSGAEKVQDLLAARLPEQGFSTGFACLRPGCFPLQRQSQNAPLYELPMKSRLDWRVSQSLARIVRDEGYQVLHAHTPRSLLVAAMAVRKCDVPLVYHVHSPALRDSTSRWRNWCNGRIEKWCLRNVSALITVSASLRREMQRHCGSQQRIHVVPNGVPAVSSGRTATPPGDRWTVGTVALFRPRKGTEVLLTALGQLRRLGYPLHLRAVGPFETVEYESHLRRHVEQLQLTDHVQWVGFTRDVAAELAQMDLFVLPSLFGEGLPMVVLEAMAAGVPVIGTRVEGVPEAVVDGQTGLLAEPGCADSLRRSVQAVLDGRVGWSTLRENGLRRHAEGFSDHAMAAGVANVYREVLC